MPPERLLLPERQALPERLGKAALAGALAVLLAAAGGCGSLNGFGPGRAAVPATPVIDRDTQVAVALADTIQTLERLSAGSPAEQAEIITTARQAYDRAHGGTAQLRYALALATPAHAGRDPERARQLLRELAANPETLAPVERALTLLQLGQLDRELGLVVDNQRLQTALARNTDQERLAAANKRLQSELDENARLRHQVEEAQAKLDAIANIERSLTERKSKSEGPKP